MLRRVERFVYEDIYLRGLARRRVRQSVAFGEITAAERMSSGRGFRLHGRGWEKLVILVRRSGQRAFEERLRAGGVLIVDECGARIDASQFAKEADPQFDKNIETGFPPTLLVFFAPNFVLNWWYGRHPMRQWSDDGEGE